MQNERHSRLEQVRQRLITHPGRGGCGVGAVADLSGRPSHDLIDLALRGLCTLEHRGGSIEDTGDGAGLLIGTDQAYFARFIAPGRSLPTGHHLSVGVFFFPGWAKAHLPKWQHDIDAILRKFGLMPLGWRHVPVDENALGRQAREGRPDIWQLLMGEGMVPYEDLPLVMFRVKAAVEQQFRDLYIASFSPTTMVYKALATGDQLRQFYRDLSDGELRTDVAVFHRRYSTNTFANWYLAQVFRTLCHNGEINTIKANRNAVVNLQAELGMNTVLMPQGSDSADLDRLVEMFVSHGVSLLEAICRVMPMSWRDVPNLSPEAMRFYQAVQRAMGTLGAWEGPAAIVATDGRYLVGSLDRMGLRPLRYVVTKSQRIILSSEIGSIPVRFEDIAETGQLDPGESVAVHLPDRSVLRAGEILARVVAETVINYVELSEAKLIELWPAPSPETPSEVAKPSNRMFNLFGWTPERVRTIKHIAEAAKEPVISMGYDRPLPAFSALRRPLSKYFKQIVAVVTNPPIDPLREGGAFDLTVHLGTSPAAHEDTPDYDPLPQYKLPCPFLTEDQFARIVDPPSPDRPKAMILDCTFDDPQAGVAAGAKAIARRIAELVRQALLAVKRGEAAVLILSDREAERQLGREGVPRLPLPMILMASALHNALVAEGRRRYAGIVVETAEVQEGHDAAVLIANGATAIYPYLFFQVGLGYGGSENLVAGLNENLKRVMSKMGICSADGYRGSRLFEAVGLAPSVVEYYLPGVVSRLGGLDLGDIYDDLRTRFLMGDKPMRDPDASIYRKEIWQELQITARGHDPESFHRFQAIIDETPPVYLRDLLQFKPMRQPIPLAEVADEAEVVRAVLRGAAMSHGALHRVAHRAIAAAFNHFGAASNCGEGGEDPRRDKDGPWADSRSRIRQVASGRFGVDARYLINADEINIKIGQGAKPGEGGMLPAAKVTAEVAMIRRTQEGVALISPPPHHDIYSIEDLAQLVYNLRQCNPEARISVKIPAVTDVGPIAVGIAKAGAHIIDISGFEGGTGAASSSSIEHAGLPLERALTEAHQALAINGLRHRVRLRADGGIKTGFDVAASLALGADEVSLGTALMIAEQCIVCQGCGNGLCPAGITTQSDLVARRLMTDKKGRAKDEELPDDEEERFQDARNGVIHYLSALAGDLRQRLAAAGLRHPDELVGRVDLLERKSYRQLPSATSEDMILRASKIDLSEFLIDPYEGKGHRSAPLLGELPEETSPFNAALVADAQSGAPLSYPITNQDRTVGATLAGLIAAERVEVPAEGFTIRCQGFAGQAFGFACVDGMRLELDGFANDSIAEAMGGGTIVVRPPRNLPGPSRSQLSVVGNAACYGATGGRLFIEGRAGLRVGVRNSGATIVVEGAGKYAFEYMTGGIGVVLGQVGPVIGSGMTGGTLYILNEDHRLASIVHKDAAIVSLTDEDRQTLKELLIAHQQETGSYKASTLLADWETAVQWFAKIVPVEVAKAAAAAAVPVK
jgi:glutamate synthase domain-containing protein 2/glutamate synthase domain-containing protein 1/glutamate synthase domain-containing protein 3